MSEAQLKSTSSILEAEAMSMIAGAVGTDNLHYQTLKAALLERDIFGEKLSEMIIVNGQALACSEPVKRAYEELEENQDARRDSLAQELREVLFCRDYWVPKSREAADLITAIAQALDNNKDRIVELETHLDDIGEPRDGLPGRCPEDAWPECKDGKTYEECRACFEKAGMLGSDKESK